jgi:hypothetical protein
MALVLIRAVADFTEAVEEYGPAEDVLLGWGMGLEASLRSLFLFVVNVLEKNAKLRRSAPAQFKTAARNR